MEKIIHVDLDKCMTCHTCEIECATAHSDSKNLLAAIQEDPLPQQRISVEYVKGANILWQCRHCEDAPCETICPTGAIGRENSESPVVVDDDKCLGCKMCIKVGCPYGILKEDNAGGVVTKCDFCIEDGETEPSCVSGCPTNAMKFISVEELSEEEKEESGNVIYKRVSTQ
ncbi:4Fe-4S dicluster domain-containing protein [Selenihalanaerobacter shriftii]|uniref:Carbon-monoxide dehydrogenase iron sulfur subunit n=1 Tax=Selenihalanaerobacter shriftii TaxID=142842 RepID=A0A1T4K752_9FIRM|nr:4Fe-4S dicluster domain-containing protein [Selenihalanaerobacter shriftii]SJZ38249.1 carbon-monoxide dehydrogenase iron sulfur subunit [Selenihalanaerobacter shriftii]